MKPIANNPPKTDRMAAVLASLLVAVSAFPAHANVELWNAVPGVSATTNWSDSFNWLTISGVGAPGPNGNDLVFGDTGAVGAGGEVTSVVDQNLLNPLSMLFTNGSAGVPYHTIHVPAGVSVTNANNLVVGRQNLPANNYVVNAVWFGAGSLVQNGVTMTIANSSTTAGVGFLPTLDLSGLSNFVASGLGTLNIAGSGSESRGAGQLNLAATSFLRVTNLTMNTHSGNNSPAGSTLNLGVTTNTIYTTNVVVGQTKGNTSRIQFFGSTGSLLMRGLTGADSDRGVSVLLGDRNNTGSGTTGGQLLFNGHPVDIKATSMVVGRDRSGSGGSTHAGSGVVEFNEGIMDVTTIDVAISTSAGTASSATGTITVGGTGTLVVGTGGVTLGNRSGGSTGATATMNINDGATVTTAGNLVKANAGAVANLNMTGGNLTIAAGRTAGTLVNPLDNMSLSDATNTVTPGSGVVMFANNLTTGGTSNVINLAALPIISSYPKQYALISYAGGINGSGFNFTLGTLPSGSPAYQGYISNNAANLTVDLVLTAGPAPTGVDIWTGAVNNNWDFSTLNWTNSGAPVAFVTGDPVRLDDTAPGSTSINLTTNLEPGQLVVSNSVLPYTLGGTGAIAGAVNLVKHGSSTLTFTNSGNNTFSGGIEINAGTVQFGAGGVNGNLPANSQSIIDNGNLVLNLSSSFAVPGIISGTGNLTQNGSGAVSLTASNTYSGRTTVNAGSLIVNGYIGGGGVVSNAPGATIGGTNTIIGTLDARGIVGPGVVSGIGTLTLIGDATLHPGGSGAFDLNATDTTPGNDINDLLAITGNLNANGNTLAANIRGTPQPGTYTVMTYSGALNGSINPVVGGTHYAANVDTNTPGQVNLVITGTTGADLKWKSTSSSAWDDASANWLNLGTLLADNFYSGDSVLFDDSVGGVVTNVVVPTGTAMYPLAITNSSSANNYTFSGGAISGNATLIKTGTSTLTLSNANSFTGAAEIMAGTVVAGSTTAFGTGAGTTTIYSNATLEVNGIQLTGEPFVVSGPGVGGKGAVINSGLQQIAALRQVTLAGDTTFGGGSTLTNAGAGRWDIRNTGGTASLSTGGNPYNITKVGTNQVSLVAVTVDGALGDVEIKEGIFGIQTTTVSLSGGLGDPNKTITVHSNATLNVWRTAVPINKIVVLKNGSTVWSENDSNILSGPVTVETGTTTLHVQSSGTIPSLEFTGGISGPGGIVKIGAAPLRLYGDNTYSGSTTITTGTVFVASGTLPNTTPISVGSGATLNLTAVAPFSLTSGQTLQGSGTVSGDLNVAAGSTLKAGTTNTIGTLSHTDSVTLGGVCTLKVDRTSGATNDIISATGTIAFGGALNVSLLGGALQAGDSFTLFKSTGGLSGAFTATNLPSPGPGLAWVTTNLGNGVLSVASTSTVNTTPTNIVSSVSGGNLTLSWPGSHTGWTLQVQTNSRSVGLNTNWYNVAGSALTNQVTVPVNPANPTVFFRLVYP
jgi:fibronectin-binding autotransporter adhesin